MAVQTRHGAKNSRTPSSAGIPREIYELRRLEPDNKSLREKTPDFWTLGRNRAAKVASWSTWRAFTRYPKLDGD